MKGKKILLCVAGSIAAFRVCEFIGTLKEKAFSVTCVMTKSAQEFVTATTLRSLTGGRVYTDLFEPFEGVLHTSLADQSDLILVMPASANMLARLAHGFADDLATCTILATKSPVVLVPAMNDHMYKHPLTRENLKKLRAVGYRVVEPVKGPLVCGREDIGHIAPEGRIVSEVEAVLKGK